MLVDFLKAASGQNLSLDGLSEEIDAMIVYHVHIMFISCSYHVHIMFYLFHSYFIVISVNFYLLLSVSVESILESPLLEQL